MWKKSTSGEESFPNHNSDHIVQALLFESGQAWEHFRHLENLANQYLAFYGGIVTAYLGIMGLIFTRSGHNVIENSWIIAAVTGPLIGTFGVAILTRLERLRYVRDFYYFKIIEPIRSYLFENVAHDPLHNWNRELNVVSALERLQVKLERERKIPYFGLDLGSDIAVGYIPLALLGAPFYTLVASSRLHFSPDQYVITCVFAAYSLLMLAIMIDINRLRRMGVFGDRYLITTKASSLQAGSRTPDIES